MDLKKYNSLIYIMDLSEIVGSTYFFGILVLFSVIYGPRLSPKLPDSIRNLFSSQAFRALVMFLVLFNSDRSLGLVMSLTIVIIFMVLMNIIQTGNLLESFRQENFTQEHFMSSEYGPPVSSCSSYDMPQSDFVGSPTYPMMDNNTIKGNTEPLYEPNIDYDKIDMAQDAGNAAVIANDQNNINSVINKYKEVF
jgi:hypothetical protein